MLSNLRLRFERLAEADTTDAQTWLDDDQFEPYFAGLADDADAPPSRAP